MAALILERVLWMEMQAHVQNCLPEEACGLVAGDEITPVSNLGHARAVYPVTNILRSPVRFRMDPSEQLAAFLAMEAQGWDLLAIYHSHPNGPDCPSPTDLAEFAYPGCLYLIWYRQEEKWQCLAYTIQEGGFHQVALHLME